MALTINEKWIRERVHLNPESLDEVRSLALPGTYHEKITHLGSSLQNFSRLKHLDLSRNALQSLDGLQHLVVLEKLNIYYNNIATLKDLYQLRHNTNLLEVDLRLNPVTKNEPDYRLFMVHMLPSLRKLDDRSVRESERKAALMHFNSDQASDLTEHLPMKGHAEAERVTNPRVEMVSNLPRKPTVLDEDDCDVLDMIARSGGDLGRPREITGSTATVSKVTAHSHQDEQRQTSVDSTEPASTKYPPSPPQADGRSWRGNTWAAEEGSTQRGDKGQGTVESGSPTQPTGSQSSTHKERARVQFSDEALGPSATAQENRDANMKYIDESQAYTTYTSKGHFTPRPDTNHNGEEPTSFRGSHLDQDAHHHSNRATEPQIQRVPAVPSVALDKSAATPSGEKVDLNLFLDNFLSLVDRYWNGTKSLHRHGKFQTQAHTLLSTLMNEAMVNVSQPQRQDVSRESVAEIAKLRQALQATQDQLENQRNQLDAALADREQLQSNLEAVQSERLPSDRSVDSQRTDRGLRTGVLERDVERLSRENEGLKLGVKHLSQLQELATMLQESHKSLVNTNDHLLQELDETKQRHLEEVKQLHWSYGELKRTMNNGF
ncbi:centrosomal protein of 72 kDa-like isoform X1 [Asterias amurensis]|uniref:centrosomal protein of 72 kDa-like isoform X1 n=1 Tax=Asterias amurensis TaxID=7602 RepID=UPI003AB3BAF8